MNSSNSFAVIVVFAGIVSVSACLLGEMVAVKLNTSSDLHCDAVATVAAPTPESSAS
jgi:hypothetical protein